MPYVMVMGSLTAPHLSKDEGATVFGLKHEERTALARELNLSFGIELAVASDQDRTVRVNHKGLTLLLVNRVHALLGYDVISHSMTMTNTNRELITFTMYRKSSQSSHSHRLSPTPGHSPGRSHNSGHSSSGHSDNSGQVSTHSNVVIL